ncbi:site-specific integrase [Brevibacillus laterosporus]|nr:site-specific integrase [Brevibacillus laterosporus]TPG70361.1 site-specific integrase [Brevibacillus laterosporus]
MWFEDLLQRGLLGNGPCGGTAEEIHAKQEYLRSWGHGGSNPHALIYPFSSQIAGLLQWPLNDARFMYHAQRVAEGTLIPVEPLYAAAMFGLLAVDIFTTTGMRINEAMQIRMSPDCIKRVTQSAPPGAKDQTPRERVCLMLIPKGERADKPHPYYIGPEQIRLMRMTMKMLQNHYDLTEKENIPEIDFHLLNRRSFRFKKKQPYLFQYNNRHLSELTIPACMKFLLHRMTFKTRQGENVVVTAHLLRHAFATHAVQVLKVPKDVVREWLQQKDLEVTDYYSQPTESMISEHHDQLLMRFASHVDLGKRVVRMPEEQVRLYEEANGKSGTLADVEGGHCVSHGFCAAKFACIGCAGKVVDPTKRYQVERKKQWAYMQLDFCQAEGLRPEVSRLEQLIRDCNAELVEMDLIEQYRKDGNRVTFIKFDDINRGKD